LSLGVTGTYGPKAPHFCPVCLDLRLKSVYFSPEITSSSGCSGVRGCNRWTASLASWYDGCRQIILPDGAHPSMWPAFWRVSCFEISVRSHGVTKRKQLVYCSASQKTFWRDRPSKYPNDCSPIPLNRFQVRVVEPKDRETEW